MAGTVPHQSVLIASLISLGQDWWYAFSATVLVETGHAQSDQNVDFQQLLDAAKVAASLHSKTSALLDQPVLLRWTFWWCGRFTSSCLTVRSTSALCSGTGKVLNLSCLHSLKMNDT